VVQGKNEFFIILALIRFHQSVGKGAVHHLCRPTCGRIVRLGSKSGIVALLPTRHAFAQLSTTLGTLVEGFAVDDDAGFGVVRDETIVLATQCRTAIHFATRRGTVGRIHRPPLRTALCGRILGTNGDVHFFHALAPVEVLCFGATLLPRNCLGRMQADQRKDEGQRQKHKFHFRAPPSACHLSGYD
jgi:hypothetical protein